PEAVGQDGLAENDLAGVDAPRIIHATRPRPLELVRQLHVAGQPVTLASDSIQVATGSSPHRQGRAPGQLQYQATAVVHAEVHAMDSVRFILPREVTLFVAVATAHREVPGDGKVKRRAGGLPPATPSVTTLGIHAEGLVASVRVISGH